MEDEEALRELVAKLLRGLGYSVVVAATAPQALVATDGAERFDLLLSDVVLPGDMQGPALARTLQDRWPGLPVLYMSGYPRDSIVRAGRLDEGIDLIEKPFTAQTLAAAIRGVLDQASPLVEACCSAGPCYNADRYPP